MGDSTLALLGRDPNAQYSLRSGHLFLSLVNSEYAPEATVVTRRNRVIAVAKTKRRIALSNRTSATNKETFV